MDHGEDSRIGAETDREREERGEREAAVPSCAA